MKILFLVYKLKYLSVYKYTSCSFVLKFYQCFKGRSERAFSDSLNTITFILVSILLANKQT